MSGKFMMFASMLTVPVSAMICPRNFLLFFILFPISAILSANWMYCKSLFFLLLTPAIFLVWAFLSGNEQSSLRSLQWICALTSGTYFASELGSSGMAAVLMAMKGFPFAGKLAELMLLAGGTASNARQCWIENAEMPLFSRVLQSVSDSVEKARPVHGELRPSGAFPVSIAVVSWLFLLVSLSGIADGVV